jgi:ABC-2 type transport system permease protein
MKDDDDIDYVFYVTAHELAHQWWAHQVIGGDVQGTEMLSESLSQYGALMVMEQEYGKPYMRKFLEYELDKYLQGRSFEHKKEQPLMLVENQQYIHYNKGSLVFYAMREYLGEEKLNKFLQQFIREKAFQEPPYTTAKEFVGMLKTFTPDSLHYIVEDMFEKIVLYDNKIISADYRQLSNGTYETTIKLEMKKMKADEKGKETEIAMNDWIEIGIYDSEIKTAKPLGKELYRAIHRFSGGETTLTVVTSEKPVSVTIDPCLLLVDRDIKNNSIIPQSLEIKLSNR